MLALFWPFYRAISRRFSVPLPNHCHCHCRCFLHGIPENSTANHINQHISLSNKQNKQSKAFVFSWNIGWHFLDIALIQNSKTWTMWRRRWAWTIWRRCSTRSSWRLPWWQEEKKRSPTRMERVFFGSASESIHFCLITVLHFSPVIESYSHRFVEPTSCKFEDTEFQATFLDQDTKSKLSPIKRQFTRSQTCPLMTNHRVGKSVVRPEGQRSQVKKESR